MKPNNMTNVLTNNLENMSYPIFTSFFTKNTGYENEVKKLIQTLDTHELPYHIEGIDSFGKWEHNCAYKPTHIHKIMETYPQRKLVWVDADSTIERDPELFFEENSIVLNSIGCYNYKSQLLSGTLFFKNDEISKNIVKKWMIKCNENKDIWDQVVLHTIQKRRKNDFGNLPVDYIKIYDSKQKSKNPVIQHWQASRRFKKTV
jgi:hypothetical protein